MLVSSPIVGGEQGPAKPIGLLRTPTFSTPCGLGAVDFGIELGWSGGDSGNADHWRTARVWLAVVADIELLQMGLAHRKGGFLTLAVGCLTEARGDGLIRCR